MERTQRLYHEDPGLRTFSARVLAVRPAAEGLADVVLDRTAFYPTGGGQPHDTGTLGGLDVLDVFEAGETVVHRVRGALPAGPVQGEVDWNRRLDHRRHHTGQHLLSRALLRTSGAETVGFHLGAATCTVDLDREPTPAELEAAEGEANRVVLADLPVRVDRYARPEDLPAGMRKEAPAAGDIRVVAIGDFDATPCCGTHCLRSGEVGPVKILRTERRRGGLRIEFVCGDRAVADYARRHRALRELALAFTTGDFEVPIRVEALRTEARDLRTRLEAAEAELRERFLEAWSVEGAGPGSFVRELDRGRAGWLGPLATALAERRREPVLLHAADGRGDVRFVLALPGERPPLRAMMLSLVAAAGGKAGGPGRLVQGRVPGPAWGSLLESWRTADHPGEPS